MPETITSDATLTAEVRSVLRVMLGHMIPASDDHGVPGGDDDAVFAAFVTLSEPHHALIGDAVRAFAAAVQADTGAPLEKLGPEALTAAMAALRTAEPERAQLLNALLANAYYTDDRVMASLDMPARAPFPEGYEVAPGDWSLLDPVRARGPIWRKC